MLTLDQLREYGADVDTGLVRCMNKEAFYLMLVGKVLKDNRIPQLEQQIQDKDYKAGFETAHA